MKTDKGFLWIVGIITVLLGVMLFVTESGPFSKGSSGKPKAGVVYELTANNLAAARRNVPVMVALFTSAGDQHGARMTRGLPALAERVKGRAIIAIGDTTEQPELANRAGLREFPAWVVYRDGEEVSRATGPNADLSLDRFIEEQTAGLP